MLADALTDRTRVFTMVALAGLLSSVWVIGVSDAGATTTQQQKLTASDGAAGDFFGRSVSNDGNTALVRATGDNDKGGDSGSAYLFALPPSVIDVDLDIKPGSDTNPINPKSKGKIPVAILSSADFDATTEVDRTSLTFGRTGDEESLTKCTADEDVNSDGLDDVVCHFNTQDTGFVKGDTEGILKGQTTGGTAILGSDTVKIVGK